MRLWLFGVFVFLFFTASGCVRQSDGLETIQVGEHNLQVAVMHTPEELRQGLSGTEQVPGDGMLFILPERQEARFWMQGMRYSIDMIWIDGDKIVGVAKHVSIPDPGQSAETLPVTRSGQTVTAVLEVPAGDFDKLELQIGMSADFQ